MSTDAAAHADTQMAKKGKTMPSRKISVCYDHGGKLKAAKKETNKESTDLLTTKDLVSSSIIAVVIFTLVLYLL